MDVEGYVRRNMKAGRTEADITRDLASRIREIKPVSPEYADRFAHAVLTEVKNTSNLPGDILSGSRIPDLHVDRGILHVECRCTLRGVIALWITIPPVPDTGLAQECIWCNIIV